MSRKFTDLTKDEIKFIVNEIFNPKKITNIKTHKRDDLITCTIHTERKCTDDNGKPAVRLFDNIVELRNPFDYPDSYAIRAQFFPLDRGESDKLKSFCYAKDIYGKSIEWLTNNPYIDQK